FASKTSRHVRLPGSGWPVEHEPVLDAHAKFLEHLGAFERPDHLLAEFVLQCLHPCHVREIHVRRSLAEPTDAATLAGNLLDGLLDFTPPDYRGRLTSRSRD